MRAQPPLARTTRLLIEELDGELMVYDQDADAAHVLSDSVARVWQLCDGSADAPRIASDLKLDTAVVRQALEELESCRLLSTSTPAGSPGYSRRDTFKKAAKVGAAVASAPLIYSLAIAPSAAMATPIACGQQVCGGPGITNGAANQQCKDNVACNAQSSVCVGNVPNVSSGFCDYGNGP